MNSIILLILYLQIVFMQYIIAKMEHHKEHYLNFDDPNIVVKVLQRNFNLIMILYLSYPSYGVVFAYVS